jgi:hypothetical protein
MSRAAAARRMGRPTRRYWLTWIVPFAVWLPTIIYFRLFDPGGPACGCVR